jgi:hypothetical protein
MGLYGTRVAGVALLLADANQHLFISLERDACGWRRGHCLTITLRPLISAADTLPAIMLLTNSSSPDPLTIIDLHFVIVNVG